MELLECPQKKFSIERYKSSSFWGIKGFPKKIPNDIRKYLPKFTGKNSELASRHLDAFMDLMGDFEINHEDVVMKLFAQSLKDDANDWYSYLQIRSIASWDTFKIAFVEQFGERIGLNEIRKIFREIQQDEEELVPYFNLRFMK